MTASTTYVPGKALSKQLEVFSKLEHPTKDVLGIPYRFGQVEFKPLQVKDLILKISLKRETSSELNQNQVRLVDKYTFNIKSTDTKIDLQEVPQKDIEEVIMNIYQTRESKIS